MAKNSVLGKPQAPHGSGHRSGFSRSQTFTFTAAAGMLLPTYREFLNPGEKVTGCPRAFIRTEPLLAPAMADLDVYVDVFFVPMTHLFSMFDSWFTQVSDDKSALWDNEEWLSHLPVVGKQEGVLSPEAFGWFTKAMWHMTNNYAYDQDYASSFGFDLHRLAGMFGYNPQGLFATDFGPFDYDVNPPLNVLPEFVTVAKNTHQDPFVPYFFQAYQKIYFDYYRDTDREINNVKAYNLDDVFNAGESRFYPASSNDRRCGMFQLRYRNRTKDYFQAVHKNPLFNSVGMLPNAQAFLSRVNNWLYSGNNPTAYWNGEWDNSVRMKSDFIKVGIGYVNTSNLGVGQNGNYIGTDDIIDSATVHFETIGSPESNEAKIYGEFGAADRSYFTHSHPLTGHLYGQDVANALSVDSSISLAQMRSAFALDRIYRTTMRAGKHVDDQILAEFGVKIPQGISGEVYKIKSYHTPFHIGEVIQTATTVDSAGNDVPLGEMAGRGVALLNSNENFSFVAPTHGVLMAIMSIAPRYKYVFAQEKDGFKTYIEDFFRPSYDNLGMQPMMSYELGRDTTYAITRAWQYRYMEDKLKFDKVSPVFTTVSKNPWSFCRTADNYLYGSIGSVSSNPFTNSMSLAWMKVSPYDLNNLFVVQFDGDPGYPGELDLLDKGLALYTTPVDFLSAYLTDPFTVDFDMKMTKVSQMSTYGEPSLGGI